MNILFVHRYYPGHYRHLAAAAAARPGNRVVFLTLDDPTPDREGHDHRIRVWRCPQTRPAALYGHPALASADAAFRRGEAVLAAARRLAARGFVPDVICAHLGFGTALHLADAFPHTPIVAYCEWYHRAEDGDAAYLAGPLTDAQTVLVRARNAPLLVELAQAAVGVCPLRFQHARFPAPFRDRLTVLHDGIDTDRIAPGPGRPSALPGLDLAGAAEIVTYATRGMEPHRGFPEFMRAARLLLEARAGLRIVVSGTSQSYYGAGPDHAASFKEQLLGELSAAERARVHFTGFLPYDAYLSLLRASSVHVYLTVPFVLSWSLLEAMAAGCAIVAADVEPVREVMTPHREGLLVDARSPSAIAAGVADLLDRPALRRRLGAAARGRIRRDYALSKLLPKQLALIGSVARLGAAALEGGFGVAAASPAPMHSLG